jgi:hypothetical protein
MRRRHLLLASCLLSSCIGLPVAVGAYAQAAAERQFDAAVARLRAGLGPEGAVEWRSRRIDPVFGVARLEGVTIRRGADRLTIEEAELAELREDRIGRARLAGLRMEDASGRGKPGPTVLTAGQVTLNALLLPPGQGNAVDWSAASVEQAVAEGFRAAVAGRGEAEIGRVTLAGYAPGAAREAIVEGLRFNDRSDGETRIQLGRARLAGAVLPRLGQRFDPWALAADAALLEGLELSVERQDATIRLGRLQVDGWGEGRLTNLVLEGAGVTGATPKTGGYTVELGRIALSGLAGRDMAYAYAHDINPPLANPGQDQDGLLESLSIATEGAPLLRIGSIRARNSWDLSTPGTQLGSASIDGLAVDLPGDYGGNWLDGMGFKRILARMDIGTRMVTEGGRLVADPFTIEAAGMGTLGFTMDMRGVEVPPPGQPAVAKDDPFALVGKWSVAGFAIRYTDEGLLRALLARQAAQERVPERQLRDRYAQMMLRTPVPGVTPGKEPPAVRQIREALASFARDLGTIEIAMRPPAPVPVLGFAAMAGMPADRTVRELNITATARPPR